VVTITEKTTPTTAAALVATSTMHTSSIYDIMPAAATTVAGQVDENESVQKILSLQCFDSNHGFGDQRAE
jgi:hypothetical protein